MKDLQELFEQLKPKVDELLADIYETTPMESSELALFFHALSRSFLEESIQQNTALNVAQIREIELKVIQAHAEAQSTMKDTLLFQLMRDTALLGVNLTTLDGILKASDKIDMEVPNDGIKEL